jgi:hypothetical protein
LKLKYFFSHLLFLVFVNFSLAQNATIRGIILDDLNQPIEGVNIIAGENGTTTNANGFFLLKIPANQDITIDFTHVSHKNITATFNLKNGEEFEFNPVMSLEVEQIATVVVRGNQRKRVEGVTTIDPEIVRTIKGAQPGVENLLKTLPGVNLTNELIGLCK